MDPIDVYVEKVEDFVEIINQLQKQRIKSELDVNVGVMLSVSVLDVIGCVNLTFNLRM